MIHIHNGDSVAATARRALLPGQHVPFKENLATGPMPGGVTMLERIEERARFLAETYGNNLLRTRNDLLEQEQFLDATVRGDDEIVLWFEHDLYCLVHLIYLLTRLTKARRVSLIWSHDALGTMPEEQLVTAYESRAAVAPMMFRIAAEAWKAYTSDEAQALDSILDREWRDFPFLREGFTLHASRFPSTADGLGEPERRAMQGIDAGATDFATLFSQFDREPPRFGFGDGEYLRILRRLASCAVPMITITEAGETPPKALFALTPAGRKVLTGESDFIDLNNAGFWLGGVHLTRERMWRWNRDRREIVRSDR